jgi:tellurite resistance protein TerC
MAGNRMLWAIFAAIIVVMLALDLGLFGKRNREMSIREALIRSGVWISIAAAFNGGVYLWLGEQAGLEFTAAYLLEEALSVDNLFVFVLIFTAFRVAAAHQHRVLFWGIIGAVVLRGIFIGVGVALVRRFHWVMIGFGVLLLYTAYKLFRGGDEDEEFNPDKNVAFRYFRRLVRSVPEFHGSHFFVRKDGKSYATPLLAVLVLVETSDVLFALDSIPAVFGVSSNPFVVYTSNIFAILGLRSMYFLLAGVMHKFRFLKTGLAVILAFIGGKMVLEAYVHVSIGLSLGFIALVLAGSIIASLLIPSTDEAPASTISGADSLSKTRGLDFLPPLSKLPKKNGKPDEKDPDDEAAAKNAREQGKSP